MCIFVWITQNILFMFSKIEVFNTKAKTVNNREKFKKRRKTTFYLYQIVLLQRKIPFDKRIKNSHRINLISCCQIDLLSSDLIWSRIYRVFPSMYIERARIEEAFQFNSMSVSLRHSDTHKKVPNLYRRNRIYIVHLSVFVYADWLVSHYDSIFLTYIYTKRHTKFMHWIQWRAELGCIWEQR